MATESKYFREQKANSLNYTVNGKGAWQPDIAEMQRVINAVDRVKADLETGILTKLRLQREQQLNKIVAERCYADPNVSYIQG